MHGRVRDKEIKVTDSPRVKCRMEMNYVTVNKVIDGDHLSIQSYVNSC